MTAVAAAFTVCVAQQQKSNKIKKKSPQKSWYIYRNNLIISEMVAYKWALNLFQWKIRKWHLNGITLALIFGQI